MFADKVQNYTKKDFKRGNTLKISVGFDMTDMGV